VGTKNNPGNFDCYANAHPDEPMFVLLGRDKFGASLVQLWALARESDDEDPSKVAEALACADAMIDWCGVAGKKDARVLAWLPFDILAAELRRRGATVVPAPHGGDLVTPNVAIERPSKRAKPACEGPSRMAG
jgi:hypothetical protein